MALNADRLKAELNSRIQAGLSRVFASSVSNDPTILAAAQKGWAQLADALSDIAYDIVAELTTNAEVDSGIPVSTASGVEDTSTGAGTTISTGKIS